jgi:hypothetical protein
MDKTHWVMDYETLKNCFAAVFEDFKQDSKIIREFVVHERRNDIGAFIDFLENSKKLRELHISYNGINFDSQITQYILLHKAQLMFMTGDEAAQAIYKQAQEVIRRSRAREWPMYQERKLFIGQIDIFRTNHWDNVNKSASLKWLQYATDWPNLQEMPIHHTTEIHTDDEINDILSYCRNDVSSTKNILHLCKKQINLRKTIGNKYDIDCYSYSNTKIGSELLLKLYCDKTNQDSYVIRKSGTRRESIPLKDIVFPYITFKDREFNELLDLINDTTIYNTKNGFKHTQLYKGYEFSYGSGGIHQSVAGIYISDDIWIIRDVDVASLYPSIAVQNGMYPAHLGKEFYQVYKNDIVGVRLAEKAKGKNGDVAIIEGFKEAANATYGNSNSQYSWLYDPQYTMQTTINGQLLISMLVEDLLLAFPDAQLLQTNTDGITMRLKRTDLPMYDSICKAWEQKTKLLLEFADYSKMFVWDINNYIAVYTDGKTKCKGRFEWEDLQNHKPTHLHKNKSHLIVSKAIFNYFVNDILPEKYIVENRNIYDYCGVSRIKGDDWYFEEVKVKDGKIHKQELQSTIRYYVSDRGSKIIKKHKKDGREIQNEAGQWLQTIFNKYYEAKWEDYQVNDSFYLQEIYKEINNIQPNPVGSQMKMDF